MALRSVGDEVSEAEKEVLLDISGGSIELNRSDPTVYESVTALEKIRSFLEGEKVDGRKVGEKFFDQYVDEYGHRPTFDSKQFWRSQLRSF